MTCIVGLVGRKTGAERDRLVLQVLPLVRRVVASLRPRRDDYEDLVQAALARVVRRAHVWDPRRSAWATFAGNEAVRGALDWARDVGAAIVRVPRVERDLSRLARRLARRGLDVEGVAVALGVDTMRAEALLGPPLVAGSLSDPMPGTDGATVGDTVRAREEPDRAGIMDAIGLVRRWLAPREFEVLWLYHGVGIPMAQIAEFLGLTESRICQIHGVALRKARARAMLAEAR